MLALDAPLQGNPVIPALLLSLSLHHHGIPLANRLTCYQAHRQQICVKTPLWKAKRAETGSWTKHGIRFIHGRWRRVTIRFPILHPVARGMFWITGYSYGCGDVNGITASGTVPRLGTISNDFLPFGTHVNVPALGYTGTVLDRGVATGGFDLFVNFCQGFPTGWYRVTYWR